MAALTVSSVAISPTKGSALSLSPPQTLNSSIGFFYRPRNGAILPPITRPHSPSFPFPSLQLPPPPSLSHSQSTTRGGRGSDGGSSLFASSMVSGVEEALPPALDSTSDPPAIFDGTTRLYISYTCPFAQRVWITRNCKGLQDDIELVPIDLQNRPSWYKEKVNPANKVPSLEHNNKVIVESLDLIKYVDSNFEGPSLFANDDEKVKFADEMFAYTDSFNKEVRSSFKEKGLGDEIRAAFDHIEAALSKFGDGPFFLGQFSLVDIAYAPFIERYRHILSGVKNYDIAVGRPKLTAWIQEMDKNEAYKQTCRDPRELVEAHKKKFQIDQ